MGIVKKPWPKAEDGEPESRTDRAGTTSWRRAQWIKWTTLSGDW